jgi:hypothetical protein
MTHTQDAVDDAADCATLTIATGIGYHHCGDYESFRDARWIVHLSACLAMAGALAFAALRAGAFPEGLG